MSDLCWPGSERAGALMGDTALLEAMVAVEAAWLAGLVGAGLAPAAAQHPLTDVVAAADLDVLSRGAEAGGNPVIGLVELLRDRLPAEPARWLHRGLTSQDVLDTALVLALRDALAEVVAELGAQVAALAGLVRTHRDTAMVGRTLTQHAVPITFGLKAGRWLSGVLDAAAAVDAARAGLAVQLGGAAGTLAATVELARLRGADDPVRAATEMVARTAAQLGLPARSPWHTARAPLTAAGDALVTCTDAWGHVAADVCTLSRPELGELAEGRPGGSSTMPGKANPVLSVLVRRAALAGPPLAATLHLAAATTVDERPDGAWHAEWATLRDLGRRTVMAASQTTELLEGLIVHPSRMQATLDAAGPAAEQQSMADLAGGEPAGAYLGVTEQLIDEALARAADHLAAAR